MTEPSEPSRTPPAKPGQEISAEASVPRAPAAVDAVEPPAEEVGGPSGAEPTRFGDWERKGRCIDF